MYKTKKQIMQKKKGNLLLIGTGVSIGLTILVSKTLGNNGYNLLGMLLSSFLGMLSIILLVTTVIMIIERKLYSLDINKTKEILRSLTLTKEQRKIIKILYEDLSSGKCLEKEALKLFPKDYALKLTQLSSEMLKLDWEELGKLAYLCKNYKKIYEKNKLDIQEYSSCRELKKLDNIIYSTVEDIKKLIKLEEKDLVNCYLGENLKKGTRN